MTNSSVRWQLCGDTSQRWRKEATRAIPSHYPSRWLCPCQPSRITARETYILPPVFHPKKTSFSWTKTSHTSARLNTRHVTRHYLLFATTSHEQHRTSLPHLWLAIMEPIIPTKITICSFAFRPHPTLRKPPNISVFGWRMHLCVKPASLYREQMVNFPQPR